MKNSRDAAKAWHEEPLDDTRGEKKPGECKHKPGKSSGNGTSGKTGPGDGTSINMFVPRLALHRGAERRT
jgi:hypothetical protein